MKSNLIIGALSALFVLGSIQVSSQNQDQEKKRKYSIEEIFNKLDSDGSGMLDMSEAEKSKKARMAKNFKKIDSNQDGLISREELKAIKYARKNRPNRRLN